MTRKGKMVGDHECEWVYGGVKFEDGDFPLPGTGAARRYYFDWFYCKKCLAISLKRLNIYATTYDPVLYNATPK